MSTDSQIPGIPTNKDNDLSYVFHGEAPDIDFDEIRNKTTLLKDSCTTKPQRNQE